MLCTKTETYLMKNESPFWCWITNSYSDLQNCAVKLIWSCNDKSSKTASSRVTPFMSISLTLRILSPGCRPRKIFFPVKLTILIIYNKYIYNYHTLISCRRARLNCWNKNAHFVSTGKSDTNWTIFLKADIPGVCSTIIKKILGIKNFF